MECDLFLALGNATVDGQTLLGANHFAEKNAYCRMVRIAATEHAADESLQLKHVRIRQTQSTFSVLGLQTDGSWGMTHGINCQRVAVGLCRWSSKVARSETGITGSELVRIVLERSHSARQAHDLLGDLLRRHGHCQEANGSTDAAGADADFDPIFLFADANEAFVVEVAGPHWVSIQCHQVRAVTDAGMIRQDWQRLSPGLADYACSQGWWRDDGHKLDFFQAVGPNSRSQAAALKRWAKAMFLLQQQNGHIDPHIFRPILQEHMEETRSATPLATRTSVVTLDANGAPALLWYTPGPTSMPLYFPLFPIGLLPGSNGPADTALPDDTAICARLQRVLESDDSSTDQLKALQSMLEQLQTRFDDDVEHFNEQAARPDADAKDLADSATAMMQAHRDAFDEACGRLSRTPSTGVS